MPDHECFFEIWHISLAQTFRFGVVEIVKAKQTGRLRPFNQSAILF
jgi:hypothetical protein